MKGVGRTRGDGGPQQGVDGRAVGDGRLTGIQPNLETVAQLQAPVVSFPGAAAYGDSLALQSTLQVVQIVVRAEADALKQELQGSRERAEPTRRSADLGSW